MATPRSGRFRLAGLRPRGVRGTGDGVVDVKEAMAGGEGPIAGDRNGAVFEVRSVSAGVMPGSTSWRRTATQAPQARGRGAQRDARAKRGGAFNEFGRERPGEKSNESPESFESRDTLCAPHSVAVLEAPCFLERLAPFSPARYSPATRLPNRLVRSLRSLTRPSRGAVSRRDARGSLRFPLASRRSLRSRLATLDGAPLRKSDSSPSP